MNFDFVRLFVWLLLCAGSVFAAEPAPVEKLSRIPLFAFGGIGFAGTTSEGEIAFKAVRSSASAEEEFLKMLKSGSPEAQCYALVGLRLKDRPLYEEKVKPFRASQKEVQTCAGCMMGKLPMASVVAGIDRGYYDDRPKR